MIDLSPEEFRRLGYQAVDLIADRLANLRDLPVYQPVPRDLRDGIMFQPTPQTGSDPADLLQRVAEDVLAYPMGNTSPGFFAWVNSTPSPIGILAELLAAAHNPSLAGGDHAATYVEHGVLNWIKGWFSFPQTAGAILTSGGSMANLIPLGVMRHVKTEGVVRSEGLQNGAAPMVIYTSEQGHSCIQKAAELLGFGANNLRKIPTDSQFRMNLDVLRAQIAADRAAGLRPVCVAASAGTVNTGAIDPLNELADLCEAEDLWLHVDGAFGGFGILAEQTAGLYDGIERADSIAVDPHKWLYIPIECGCALVKDAEAMRAAFSLVPPYLRDPDALPWFSEYGPQQTRGFRALKLWLTIQHIGEQGYRKLITNDIAMTQKLADRISARPDFTLVAQGPLSALCFRYTPPDVNDYDKLNRRLLPIVQKSGDVFITGTELNGQFVIRSCIVNFRMVDADLDCLLETITQAGQQVLEG